MNCPKCNSTEFIERGFKRNNYREECLNCGATKYSFYSRTFGNFQGFPKWSMVLATTKQEEII